MNGAPFLSGLWPPFAGAVRYLDAWCQYYGVTLTLVSGSRSLEEQAALYAQGRSADEVSQRVKKFGKGGAVTDAPPGYSAHNYGLAVDVGGDDVQQVIALAKAIGFGTVSWDPDHIEWPGWTRLVGLT